MDKTRDRPSQIEKRVHFDRRLVERKSAHGNNERHNRSSCCRRVHSVGEINPEVLRRHKVCGARRIKTAARSDHMRQSRNSFASANVDFATAPRNPMPYNFEGRARRQASMSRSFRDTSFARTPWCGIVQCNAGSARERLRHTSPQCDLNSSWDKIHDLRKQRPASVHAMSQSEKSRKLPQNRHPKFKSTPNKIHPNLCYKKPITRLRRLTDGSVPFLMAPMSRDMSRRGLPVSRVDPVPPVLRISRSQAVGSITISVMRACALRSSFGAPCEIRNGCGFVTPFIRPRVSSMLRDNSMSRALQ